MRIIVSLDKLREAEDPTLKVTEWDAVRRGLCALVRARAWLAVQLVVTPPSAPFLFRAVTWLWKLGVVRVSASPAGTWSLADRTELRRELVAVGRELLRRRLRGEERVFEPFLEPRGEDWWQQICTRLGKAVMEGVAAAERAPRLRTRRRSWGLPAVVATLALAGAVTPVALALRHRAARTEGWCGTVSVPPDTRELVAAIRDFADQACACADAACINAVAEEAAEFAEPFADGPTPNASETQAITDATQKWARCADAIVARQAARPTNDPAALVDEYIELADRICACRDQACLMEAMPTAQELGARANELSRMMTPEQARTITFHAQKLVECAEILASK